MLRLVHIKDVQYNRYIVAGDVWDGAVYHQEDKTRPNAVWAELLWESIHNQDIYRFIDLRHGHDLMSRGDGSVGNLSGDGYFNKSIEEIDQRAQWIRNFEVGDITRSRIVLTVGICTRVEVMTASGLAPILAPATRDGSSRRRRMVTSLTKACHRA